MDVEEAVKALALEWLQSIGMPATSVRSMISDGTDWAGSTSGGFYEKFTVDITYATAEREYNSLEVGGEKMASLWQFALNRAAGQASSVPA